MYPRRTLMTTRLILGNTRWVVTDGLTATRVVRALTPLPSQCLVRSGADMVVLNEAGQPVGVIYSPGKMPRLGRNQATCYLRRDW